MSQAPRLGLIAYEYPPLIGGMATYARALATHMHQRGYEVHVFANERSESEPPVEVHPILTTDLARDLPRLARFEMDIWHAINFGYAPLAFLKRPFVLTVHGTDFLRPWVRWKMDRLPVLWRADNVLQRPRLRRLLAAPALRCVDQVLTCSRFSARLFRREYGSAGPIEVVPNGVDVGLAASDATHPPAVRHPRRLLTVCNLDIANRRKNVDGCLRAMAKVGERLDLQYWIVGDGAYRPELVRLADELGIARRVRFLGRVTDRELRDAYASASLFVLVPRSACDDVEGFGIVYLEAAAFGTPSLASRIGGAPDAIADGRSGFFVDEPTADGIADALTQFFSGGIRFEEEQVRRHAGRFAWSTVLGRVENVYRRLTPLRPVRHIERMESAQTKPVRPLRPCNPRMDWHQWVVERPDFGSARHAGRVLLISYMFPPVGGSGVQRPAKLARHLAELGWSVEVLTAAHDRFPWRDDSLCSDIGPGVGVHRVAGWEPACLARRCTDMVRDLVGTEACENAGTDACRTAGTEAGRGVGTDAHGCKGTDSRGLQSTGGNPGGRHGRRPLRWIEDRIYWRLARQCERLGMGNGEPLWTGPAVGEAIRLHRREAFDAIISTGPPHFVHRVAMSVAGHTGLPWIADLRDPLVHDYDRSSPDGRHVARMRKLERAIVHNASIVVTTCPSLRDELRGRHPGRAAEAITTITNGFDREDLQGAARDLPQRADVRSECLFAMAGSFYGRRELVRIIEPMQRVLDEHAEWLGRVHLTIAGTVDAQQRRRWQEACPAWVEMIDYVDHSAAIRMVAEADCAIVMVPECRTGRMTIPGKLFELLALPTHVLGLVPPGSDTEAIISEAGAATTACLEDAGAVARAIDRIVTRHFAGTLPRERNWPALDVYDRRATAARFHEYLEAVTVKTPSRAEVPAPSGSSQDLPRLSMIVAAGG